MKIVFSSFFIALILLGSSTACSKKYETLPDTPLYHSSKKAIYKLDASIYTSKNEIEAIAGTRKWLLWAEDNVYNLFLADTTSASMSIEDLGKLPHDIDLLCIAKHPDETTLNVFIHDGDQAFYQYWLELPKNSLRLVRKIASNPDIESCSIYEGQLIYEDPNIGTLSFDINPETDAVIKAFTPDKVVQIKFNTPNQAFAASENRHLAKSHVNPVLETTPVKSIGDAADDPAILVTENTTWIAGTDKKSGLSIYDLKGEQLHFNARGRLNNVDAIKLDEKRFVLAASNRTYKTIDLFLATPETNSFEFLNAIPLTLDDPYGLCMSKIENSVRVFVGDSESLVQHWLLSDDLKGGKLVHQWTFSSQTEGCVAHPNKKQLFIGQEELGIWSIDLDTNTKEMIQNTDSITLVADVEGMDIYQAPDANYLIASSQGDDSFVIYQLEPWRLLGKFSITANISSGIDGASETDGLAVSSQASKGFPKGMLVVQDGRNRAPVEPQNFKVVDWKAIDKLISEWKKTSI